MSIPVMGGGFNPFKGMRHASPIRPRHQVMHTKGVGRRQGGQDFTNELERGAKNEMGEQRWTYANMEHIWT